MCSHLINLFLQVKAVLERSKLQEKTAKGHIWGTYNPERLPLPDWKVAQANMKQRLTELEEAASEAAQVLTFAQSDTICWPRKVSLILRFCGVEVS